MKGDDFESLITIKNILADLVGEIKDKGIPSTEHNVEAVALAVDNLIKHAFSKHAQFVMVAFDPVMKDGKPINYSQCTLVSCFSIEESLRLLRDVVKYYDYEAGPIVQRKDYDA